mgnify:CR=1 FL=1
MHWIALFAPTEERLAWSWRALQFTPRVAWVDEALVLEVSGSERLWGGRQALLQQLFAHDLPLSPVPWARGATALVAIARLRLRRRGQDMPSQCPDGLPLDVLTAAQLAAPMLARMGCTCWADVRALPRGGMARRFGAGLLEALDQAYGERPERYPWLQLPEVFDQNLELQASATTAPELMWTAQRLLAQLQVWLRARGQGVLALELQWTLDLKRLDGTLLPPHQQLTLRTAEPVQDMAHLRRLMNEHLARVSLAAPANHLRLRSLETRPWTGVSQSFLPEDNQPGERLHQLIERLCVRLGDDQVLVPQAQSDHRPERMQAWVSARGQGAGPAPRQPTSPTLNVKVSADALYPSWLLPKPLPLEVRRSVPHYGGPLRRLTRLHRVETGWWEGPATLRDYFLAQSPQQGLVWIYRERPLSLARELEQVQEFCWYLQGVYA